MQHPEAFEVVKCRLTCVRDIRVQLTGRNFREISMKFHRLRIFLPKYENGVDLITCMPMRHTIYVSITIAFRHVRGPYPEWRVTLKKKY